MRIDKRTAGVKTIDSFKPAGRSAKMPDGTANTSIEALQRLADASVPVRQLAALQRRSSTRPGGQAADDIVVLQRRARNPGELSGSDGRGAAVQRIPDDDTTSAETLTEMASPQVFQGPEVEVQQQIVDALEGLVLDEGSGYPHIGKEPAGVICLGLFSLPNLDTLEGDLADSVERLLPKSGPVEPSLSSQLTFVPPDTGLQKKIIRNTLATMHSAQQIAYLRKAGLTNGDWQIWAEVHYYRDRVKTSHNLHQDTMGQTLFFNLNFISEHEDIGPEYIVNPPPVAEHQAQIQQTMPGVFLNDLDALRENVKESDEVEYAMVPANGAVATVDEAVHHMTPFRGHRALSKSELGFYLSAHYDDYKETLEAMSKRWRIVKSLHRKSKLEKLITLTEEKDKIEQTDLSEAGCDKVEIEKILDYTFPGYNEVQIPNVNRGEPAIKSPINKLPRRMSTDLNNRSSEDESRKPLIPAEPQGRRAFFRTWIRAVRVGDAEND